MKKILEQIGVRLYALRNVPEYRIKSLISLLIFIVAVLTILCIYETVVY